jgi:serine/threonine protein phosphatase PrpC
VADADDGGRVKRPARVPRATDDAEASEAQQASDQIVAIDLLPEHRNGQSQAPTQASGAATAPATDDVPVASAGDVRAAQTDGADVSFGSAASAIAAEDSGMPALESLGREAPTPVRMPPAARETMPPAAPAAVPASPGDGLPWPLPAQMIVGGRYRIEAVSATMPDAPGAENTYLVSDLQGYERCWSCGMEYGTAASSDQFCRECGADMLAREYVMRERRLTVAEVQPEDVTAAPGQAEQAEQGQAAEQSEPGEPGEQSEVGDQVESGDVAGEMQQAEQAPEQEGTRASSEAAPDVREQAERTGHAGRAFTQGVRAYYVEPYTPEPTPFPHGIRVVAAVASDAGQLRAADGNEDSVGLLILNAVHGSVALPLALCIVADGLGGHVSGQDASRLVVRALTDHVLRSAALPLVSMVVPATPPEEVLRQVLLEGAQAANTAVYAANHSSGGDMGSTLVAALICGDTAYIANAGDSRAYVLDDGGLRRISTDHSLVEQLVAGGLITPEERYTHPKRNQIFRSLGDEPSAQVDIFTQHLRPGMRLLLCSDGLWEMVRDDELAAILREVGNPREACDTLVRRANEQGGDDNISALVIEVSA